MDALENLLADLVRIDSVNPDLVPGGAGEAAVAAFVADWLQGVGIDAQLEDVRPGRPNVVARLRGSGGGRTLMLNGHLDTVGVVGMDSPHSPRVAGGRMYGRGAYDMKCGLAAAMLALVAIRERSTPLRGDVLFTAVIDEENAGLGTRAIAERYTADGALIAEPTELSLIVAHRGFAWHEIETHGVAAHGSLPEEGVDAIAHMGRVLVAFEGLQRVLASRPAHPLLRTGSLHAGLIRGGQELTSYPASCVLGLERRTLPGETLEVIEAEYRGILERLATDDPAFSATLRPLLACSPMETDPQGPLATAVRAAAAATLGQEPETAGAPFWTDGATLAEVGIPAVLFGPGGAGAHAFEEWVDLESVRQCVAIYARVIDGFCA
ncbi:MAG TPA: ArgE/DapE family deacylase [Anaerolineales bacterium]|nr:ArgE/DapE family deacylase [Anaerolineales bacterium]